MSTPPCATGCGNHLTTRKDRPASYAGVNGWCTTCTRRWYNHGRPAGGPPAPMPASQVGARPNAARAEAAAWRLAEFTRLRRMRYTVAQAGMRLGVSSRTALKYEKRMLEMAAVEGLAA